MPIIQISKGKTTTVDEVDYQFLTQWQWTLHSGGYTYRNSRLLGSQTKPKTIYMHRLIMERMMGGEIPDGQEIDHQDGNPLNNCRENLRLATRHQNRHNTKSTEGTTSPFKGVSRSRSKSKWRATITHNNKQMHLGYYDCEEDAARAYDAAALSLQGEFARLNFP